MYVAWMMDMRAQPPEIVARVEAQDRAVLVASVQALTRAFPEGHTTWVHGVNAEPLHIAPPDGRMSKEEYDRTVERMRESLK